MTTTATRATISTTKLEMETINNNEWSSSSSSTRQLLDLKAMMAFERGGAQLSRVLARKSMCWARDSLEKLPIKLTMENVGVMTIISCLFIPRALTYCLVYPIFRLVFGTLYPAYASYKAVRTKNVKEYVKWMMYWIVFALFTCAETFTDVFFSFWFPFYYEIKIILVLWLLSPATKGSSILYRRFVHPALCRREAEIDEALARATEQGYSAVLQLGTKGVNYATTMLMQTAIKNLPNVVPLSASQSDSAISSSASNQQLPMMTKDTTDNGSVLSKTTTSTSRRQRRRTKSVEALHGEVRHITTYVVDESDDGSMSIEEEDLEMSFVYSAEDMTNDDIDKLDDIKDDFKKPQQPKKTKKANNNVDRDNSVTRRKPRTRGQSARSAGFGFDSD